MKTNLKVWTHAELVARAARWLRNTCGCKIVLSEQESFTGEIPDVIGWKKNGRSTLIECKTSRADFLADARKPFRAALEIALGAERYYFAPPDIIRVSDLPPNWGLIEVYGPGCRVIAPCRPRKDLRSEASKGYETRMLVAALTRVAIRTGPDVLEKWLRYENRNLSLEDVQTCMNDQTPPGFPCPLDMLMDAAIRDPIGLAQGNF